jgi:hypothetical protein
LLLGCGLGVGQAAFRGWCGELGWVGLFAVGGAFAAVNAVVLFGADRILGGDSPAEHVMGRVLLSGRMGALLRRLRMA